MTRSPTSLPTTATCPFESYADGAAGDRVARPPHRAGLVSEERSASDARRAQFEALVEPEIGRLLQFAGRRLASQADAEDLVQDVCLRAWDGFASLRDVERTRAWLFRICRTLLAEHYRTRARRRSLVSLTRLEAAQEAVTAADAPDPLEETLARLTRAQVHRALGTIPEDFAVAVELHDIDGFRYREIADILDVPIGTVMSRIARGRRLLAGVLVLEWAEPVAGTGDSPLVRPLLRNGNDGR